MHLHAAGAVPNAIPPAPPQALGTFKLALGPAVGVLDPAQGSPPRLLPWVKPLASCIGEVAATGTALSPCPRVARALQGTGFVIKFKLKPCSRGAADAAASGRHARQDQPREAAHRASTVPSTAGPRQGLHAAAGCCPLVSFQAILLP